MAGRRGSDPQLAPSPGSLATNHSRRRPYATSAPLRWALSPSGFGAVSQCVDRLPRYLETEVSSGSLPAEAMDHPTNSIAAGSIGQDEAKDTNVLGRV